MNNFGGESLTYWTALAIATLVKWIMSQRSSVRQAVGGVAAGFLLAYFGHDFVIRNIGFFKPEDEVVVSIVLVLTGEHLVRSLMSISPEKALHIWRGK